MMFLVSKLPLLMALMVCTAVTNTIVRRIALVPLEHYSFLLTQVASIAHVLFYGCVFLYRKHKGIITSEMLRIPILPFVWIGFWDGIGLLLGNLGTSHLPGYFPPLLAKLNLPFTAIFSTYILQNSYDWRQLCSIALVISGSLVALIPNFESQASSHDRSSSGLLTLIYLAVYICSVAPAALSNVLKEKIFRDQSHMDLDIFVVNTIGSCFTLLFTFILLPFVVNPGHVEFSQIPRDMGDAISCFIGNSPVGEDCSGDPYLPLMYISINICYNIAFLLLVKYGGALLTFVTNTLSFPISALLFAVSWPYLKSQSISWYVIGGLGIEISGVILFRWASTRPKVQTPVELDYTLLEGPVEDSGV